MLLFFVHGCDFVVLFFFYTCNLDIIILTVYLVATLFHEQLSI